jgi:hypothetical protein
VSTWNGHATRAGDELGKHIDELYAKAIDRYIEVNKDASAGSLRSRSGLPHASPPLIIEIPEELVPARREARQVRPRPLAARRPRSAARLTPRTTVGGRL